MSAPQKKRTNKINNAPKITKNTTTGKKIINTPKNHKCTKKIIGAPQKINNTQKIHWCTTKKSAQKNQRRKKTSAQK